MDSEPLDTESGDGDPPFKPLTAQQACAWRKRHAEVSVWKMLVWQAVAGGLTALCAWALAGRQAGWSAAWGAWSVVLPAAIFARGALRRSGAAAGAGAAVARFFVWELVKLVLCIAMLAAAHRLIPALNWLALLAGVVVTMKTSWLALLMAPSRKSAPLAD